MRVSVHFDTDSEEFAYFARTRQLALGPPHLTPVNSFRPPSFHNLQPHPSVVEIPRQPISVHNGWNPNPQPLPPGVDAWGDPEGKDQLIIPPLSAVSGDILPTHTHVTEASSSASPAHSPPSVPLQLEIADPPVRIEQPLIDPPADPPLVISDVIEVVPDGELPHTSVVSSLKPTARLTSLSRLSLLPNLFQYLHDYGLF